ncbi:hypothetical protein AWC38_SpisGene7470 [Stylophora pistillata]|uniref:Uncharacterized protein n=1 Tax=Stylophora pistillata TaxID=50429 RepID=A0A2B4SAW8_STYPI|nr:hypothetical protein AWC38_SpisGene7470 [Stylophora pistillata]
MWLRVVVGVTAGALVCLKAIPHIFPQLYYKRIKELKIDGREMEIPPRCKEQLAVISRKLGVSDKQVERRLNHYREFKADEMSARCDLEVAKGGVDWMLKKKRFVSLMKSLQAGDKSKEMHFNIVDSTHPKLLDRLRRLEVIVDEKIKSSS